MFYEIRRYRTRPGRRDEWVRYMEEVVIPFQTSKGMTVTASFTDEEDPDGYIWIRRFDSEARRVRLYAAVYDDDHWTDVIDPVVQDLLLVEKSVVTRAAPTPAFALGRHVPEHPSTAITPTSSVPQEGTHES
ncbi:NIPSNAP family protein [Embleya hyalina]|uniref:NIPSNAP family protein n=1 Tax=Embleya hyalina TaxID=516124 RepID=A0A401YEW6_9ACTN|nr:NIPSNAP family protein [Embleya hyalina]GCD93143.1 NIPSNAP family protein [Embleya hyalina]